MKIREIFSYILRFLRRGEVHYIGGSLTLPPPLSKEEEEKYIARLDENSKDVKNILIEHNLRLVVYIAKKFENTNVGAEDLISIGTIGLIKAINTFKPDKKIKLGNLCVAVYRKRNSDVSSQKQQPQG